MKSLLILTTAIALCVCLPLSSVHAEAKKKSKTFSINFENTEIRSALELLAGRAGLRLSASQEITGTINYSFANVTLDGALRQISRENGLSYKYTDNGFLQVSKAFGVSERSPASEADPTNSRHLRLKYITVGEAFNLVSPLAGKDDRIIRDEPTNSLVFMGPDATFEAIKNTIATFDLMPQQILIEANIVELNKNKSREFGFSYGDFVGEGKTSNSAIIKNKQPSEPNFAMQLGLGQIDGVALAMRLAAAEVEGAAKILSRPKIVTINNKPATISSGISYSIRTVAAVSSGSGSSSTDKAAAGVATVSAGLNLSVTPTVVGDDQVKLSISVSNSEPDLSAAVDGIPGIVNNSTNTEIIVQNGKTASVAGLIKNQFSESESGVPFLRKIPIIGWLFTANTKSDRDKELMVFITPKIIQRDHKELNNEMDEVQKKFPEVVLEKAPFWCRRRIFNQASFLQMGN